MAPFPNPTFGCGNFLPGFGPFSIPKFKGPKNIVNVPGGDGDPPPPPEEEHWVCVAPPENSVNVNGTCPPTSTPGLADPTNEYESATLQECLSKTQNPDHPCGPNPPPYDPECKCCVISETEELSYIQGGSVFGEGHKPGKVVKTITKIRKCQKEEDVCGEDMSLAITIKGNIRKMIQEGYQDIRKNPPTAFDEQPCPTKPSHPDPLPPNYNPCCEVTPGASDPECCPPVKISGWKPLGGPGPGIGGGGQLEPPGLPGRPTTPGGYSTGIGSLIESEETPTTPVLFGYVPDLNNPKSLTSSRFGSGLRGRKIPEIPPKSVLQGKMKDSNINLNDLSKQTSWGLTQDTEAGPFDPDIDILVPQQTEGDAVVRNRLDVRKNIFNRNIGTGLDYTIRNSNIFKDWNSGYGYKVTPQTVIKSIDPQLLSAFKNMKKIDGSRFTRKDVYTIFRTRILDGTINSYENPDLRFDPNEFFKLARKTKDLQIPNIQRSTNAIQNQGAALAWLELNSIPADVNAPPAEHINKIMNWKFLPTDINMYIPISVGGEIQKLFVKDTGTFSPYSTLTVQDGDYIIVGGKKLFCNTERDHAIIPSEGATQTAIKLLGGTGHINLTVSSPASLRVEYNNNLNLSGEDPREQMIFAKLEASTIVTEKTPQSLLYKTKATYKVVDTDTAQGLSDFNDYIKYKFFHRTFTMSWDDLFLDHLAVMGEYQVESEDVIFNAPKTNKNIPLLTRRIPYYIGILPTNRQKYLPFNEKSVITQFDLDTDIVERRLKTVPTIDPDFWEDGQFVQAKLGWPEGNQIDIFGKTNIQNIISEYNPSATIYKEAYKVDGKLTTGTNVRRNKKFLRTLYDIVVNNLDQNYILEKQGIGRGVYWFDIFSRVTLTEFNRFTFLSNASTLIPIIAKGLFKKIKIFSPLKHAGEVAANKTCLLRRKEDASADTYPQIKRTNITKQRFVYSTTGVSETDQALTQEERTEAEAARTAQTLY